MRYFFKKYFVFRHSGSLSRPPPLRDSDIIRTLRSVKFCRYNVVKFACGTRTRVVQRQRGFVWDREEIGSRAAGVVHAVHVQQKKKKKMRDRALFVRHAKSIFDYFCFYIFYSNPLFYSMITRAFTCSVDLFLQLSQSTCVGTAGQVKIFFFTRLIKFIEKTMSKKFKFSSFNHVEN